jgi:methylthioribose-1-phosphate isomerase
MRCCGLRLHRSRRVARCLETRRSRRVVHLRVLTTIAGPGQSNDQAKTTTVDHHPHEVSAIEYGADRAYPGGMGPRTFDWVDNAIVTPDQRLFPDENRSLRLATVDDLVAAIRSLAVRGAPALGVAGAFGVALSAYSHPDDPEQVKIDADRIANARPTAVNLGWGVARALTRLDEGPAAVLAEAKALLDEDERVNRTAATRAADLLRRLGPDRRLRVLTHCNAGRLATGAWGTALGAIRDLADRDAVDFVIATETRPLLQGARLTAWELAEAGIPYRVCVDSAAPALISRGLVDCVVVGADRIAVQRRHR